MKNERRIKIVISERQLTNLIDNLVLTEEKAKSEFIRPAINEKIERGNLSAKNQIKKI